jgi:rod shape-determining protein MreD
MLQIRQARFGRAQTAFELQLVPVLSTLAGSLLTLIPAVATAPVLPPAGLLTLLGWRLHRREIWPAWAGLPLGLFDDIFSGQPIGSAMVLWTLALLAMEVFDRRMIWRDAWQDWELAGGLITAILVGGLGVAHLTGGSTSLLIIFPQIVTSILLFPLAARLCAALDRWRLGR